MNVERLRRVNGQKRPKNCRKVFLAFSDRHRLREVANGNIKEFLDNLITNNALAGGDRAVDQIQSVDFFLRLTWQHRVNKNVGVDKKVIVHSSLHERIFYQRRYD